ncbi:MAG: hypothetical protein GXN93_01150 [Candidatus Diapherotrites archaeon]|nr:hypothetical protein [Candidatus Diapherotrites archaeon]
MRGYAGIVVGFVMAVILLSIGSYVILSSMSNAARVSEAQNFVYHLQAVQKSMGVTITSVDWRQINDTIYITAENTGSQGFDLNSVDLFAGGVFVGSCGELNCSDASGDGFVAPGESFTIVAPLDSCPSSVVISPGPGVFSTRSVRCSYAWLFFDSPPTPAYNATISSGSTADIRIRATSTDVNQIYLDWNGYAPLYRPALVGDSSIHDISDANLVLAMSFNDVAAAGENYADSNYVHDYSVYSNSGQYSNVTYTAGPYGGAFYFDGDSNIYIPDAQSLDISGSLSISAWLLSHGLYGTILAKTGSYALVIDYNRLRFIIWSESNSYNIYGPIGISDGLWHHVTAVYDSASGTLSLYVDGSEVNSVNVGVLSIDVTSNPVYLGEMQYWTGYDLNGILDDVALYSRALTPSEIWWNAHAATYALDGNTYLEYNTPALSSGTYYYYGWAETTSELSDYTHDATTGEEYNADNPWILNVT